MALSVPATTAELRGPTEIVVSVVLPCLNEEEAVGSVVREALEGLDRLGVSGEVIVVDNGSTDRSAASAEAAGARLVHERRRGYGSAYLAGLAAARGEFIVLADADGTYDLRRLDDLVAPLQEGRDVVLGSRLRGVIEPGAMPWSHRWIGNPVLTRFLNVVYGVRVSDAHCGIRALRRSALPRLDLHTTGMEFASEMVLKAARRGLDVAEVPVPYRRRRGDSKLSRYRDAWRHVRLMLLHSPTTLFLIPGGLLFLVGAVVMLALAGGPVTVGGRGWEIHSMIFGSIATLVGAQIVQLGVVARAYAVVHEREHDALLERLWDRLRLEHGLAAGGAVLAAGLGVLTFVVARWALHGFGNLHEEHLSVLGLTFVGLGTQVVFTSFLLSIIGLRRAR
ncbi:MAG TPA: glycosyltransferase family 2 protein [Gaiellaceae bacterium]|nr:glycosyltransferase family 2 protein [Gaiellaceae bacterium]